MTTLVTQRTPIHPLIAAIVAATKSELTRMPSPLPKQLRRWKKRGLFVPACRNIAQRRAQRAVVVLWTDVD